MIGKRISYYKIVEELGRGGMGVVYRAQDTKLDRFVAIKVLSRHLDSDPAAKKRFIHEAKTASSLDHPNVGYIHEIGETDDGRMFIAMAYYHGTTIDKKISSGQLPIKDVLDFAVQTAEGLRSAHTKSIVHRDVKPANLLVTDDGVVKILDFGVAKMASQTHLTKTGASIGTTMYMSPEQARGETTDDRADIWALGVTIYEMLAGTRPFNSEYESAVIYSILNEEPEFVTKIRPDTPVALERVIEKSMAKKVEQRFQTMDEVLVELRDVQVEFSAGTAKTKSLGLARKQRFMLKRAMGGVSLVVIATAIFWWFSDRQPISIAVLPLRYATPDTTQNYFIDGVHEGLIGDFLKIGGWRVRGRSSVMQFRDATTPVQEIAKILDVDYVFEGVITRVESVVQLSARLIDAPRDEYIWSRDFEDDFSAIEILKANISLEVASQAGIDISAEELQRFARTKPVNPKAQEAYYLGRYHWGKYTRRDFNESLRWFEVAKSEDPNFAPAYAGAARTWAAIRQMGFLPPDEATLKLTEEVEKALELDSTLAEIHYLKALANAWQQWDWAAAEVSFQKAIEANPNLADNRALYSHYLIHIGRMDEGREQAERALELDPISTFVQALNGWSFLLMGDLDNATKRFLSVLEVQPDNLMALDGLWDSYSIESKYVKALESARELYLAMAELSVISAFDQGFEEDGYQEAMLRAAELMANRADSIYTSAYDVARLFLNAGKNDKALLWLERGLEERSPNLPYIGQPLWDPLRSEPRFSAIFNGMGLPQ